MRVVVTGGSGQLARAIQETWSGHEVLLPPETELDLTKPEAIRTVLQTLKPQAVVNAGAFTQVDRCETEEGLATLVNGTAVAWLAESCDALKATLIQISTDYVFDGTATRPYREDDPTHPVSAYGHSKLRGEENAALAQRHLIVRTAWLYDAWGKNFFLTMVNAARQGRALRVVDDQRGTPTSCRALARQLHGALNEGWQGIVHGTCGGDTTWHGFAAEIFRQMDMSVDLSPCTTAEYPTPAKRPAYSVLAGGRRKTLGTDLMPTWEEALEEVVAAFRSAEAAR
ncbi:MAG: dTDP-4-dehydrorhamnose reductase [Firmicutes bacterium]|nr:dTDP-4-dehydrorhamnose reductase [Bacillota bacterium]